MQIVSDRSYAHIAEPTRVAFCITELDPGGAENALVQVVRRLDRTIWEPRVFCLAARGPLAEDLEEVGVPVECLGATRTRPAGAFVRLVRSLRRFQPAILQTWLYHANLAGRLAAKVAGVPHVVSGIRVAERRNRLRLWCDRLTDRLVERHVCVSEGVAKFSVQVGRLPSEKIVVIPNGVEFERFAAAAPTDLTTLGIPAGSRVLLFVGRLDPQKDPRLLLDAFSQLGPNFADVHLLFVGKGPLEAELASAAKSSSRPSQVHWLGRRDDVAGLMRSATVLVLPSRWEGMPNVVLEAMAAGLPVVAAEVEGVAELLRGQMPELLFPIGDRRGCQTALERVLADPQFRSWAGQELQHIVKKWFTWDHVAAAYTELYQHLLMQSRNCRR